MHSKFVIAVVAVACLGVGWKLRAQTEGQTTIVGGPSLVATDADLQLLRQDLRAQKQKLIAQNLPMTESEAVKFWAVYNRYTGELRDINEREVSAD